jgi:GT2 family glycosyltransferase
MRASIIISTYTLERLNDVKASVDAITSQISDDIEILLVLEDDPQLIKGVKSTFEGGPVKVLISEETGITNARNLGVRESTGEIIIFLDDDAIPSPGWLDKLLEPYQRPDILAVGGGVVPEWIGKRPKWFPEEMDWLVGCYYEGHSKKTSFVRNIIGANMSFRREVFSEVGFFSTEIGAIGKKRIAGDDSEFCMRLRVHYGNDHILYRPSAEVRHRVPPSRQTMGYCYRRAYVEGVSKAVIARMFDKGGNNKSQLDTEWSYLKHVFLRALPSKLFPSLRNNKRIKWGEFISLFSCTVLVILGYARGKIIPVKGAMHH